MARLNISRKSGFIQRSGVMRRETLWLGGSFVRSTLVGAASALVTSLNAAALAQRPFTIVRTRGFLHYRSDQEVASENYSGSYGAAVVSDQAVAIGVTAIPTPVTDSESDLWHLYEAFGKRFALGSGVAFTDVGDRIEIDSKAMRKVEEGQDIVDVVEGSGLSTGIIVLSFNRTLIKLH